MRDTIVSASLLALLPVTARAADRCTPPIGVDGTEGFTLVTSSYVGTPGVDRVWGAAILGDGTIVLAGRFGGLPAAAAAARQQQAFGAGADAPGVVMALAPDGQAVQWVTHVGDDVVDLAADDAARIYVGLGAGGIGSLDAQGEARWSEPTIAAALDVSVDGTVGVLVAAVDAEHQPADTGAEVRLFTADGAPLAGPFAGLPDRFHTDVAIDGERVYATGFHVTASCNNPVHVAFVRAWDFAGEVKWTDYAWPGDALDPGCDPGGLDNNMADTRGYALARGADGRLYAAFEAAGGNHIFRYDPKDLALDIGALRKNTSLGNHAEMHDSKSEHKSVIVRLDPASGDVLAWQQWVARLGDYCGAEAANTIRTKGGDIAADAAGRVYLTGASAWGMYMTHDPFVDDPYRGGFYMSVFGPELDSSPYSTRHFGAGQGHAVAVRERPGEPTPTVMFAGDVEAPDFNYTASAIQPAIAGEGDGVFVVLNAFPPSGGTTGESETGGEPPTTGAPTGSDSAGPGATTSGETTGAASSTGVDATDGAGGSDANTGGSTDAGCGCRSSGASFGWLALGLAAWRRRRPR